MKCPIMIKMAARGNGIGVGGKPQGDFGADTCVCPKCGYKEKHTQAAPCSSKKCPKCGTAMGGANSKEKTSMEKSALSTKLLASAARKATQVGRRSAKAFGSMYGGKIGPLSPKGSAIRSITSDLNRIAMHKERQARKFMRAARASKLKGIQKSKS